MDQCLQSKDRAFVQVNEHVGIMGAVAGDIDATEDGRSVCRLMD